MADIIIRPNYHIGHIMMESMRKYSNLIGQIDGATDQKETFASILSRSIKLAKALRKLDLKPGDVMAVSGWNHLDIHIPYYSGLFNGQPIFGIDPFFKFDEIKELLLITIPKVVFCENEFYETYAKVIKDLGLDTTIITFRGGSNSMTNFMNSHNDNELEEKFKVAEFDIDVIYPVLMATSGTTGKVKVVAFTQQPLASKLLFYAKFCRDVAEFTDTKALHLSPVNWISTCILTIATPFSGQCIVQTSIVDDIDIVVRMINKYKPVSFITTPTLTEELLKLDVDLSCFKYFIVTGAKVYPEMITDLRARVDKSALVTESYGQTETIGHILVVTKTGVHGKPHVLYNLKLADPDTGKEILESNVPGELLMRGPCFTEYYNDHEETKKCFTEDGFYKTKDLMYRDEKGMYHFVDRLKTIIKWRTCTVLPAELEELIRTQNGVSDCCVVGIDHPDDGQHPVACVVRKKGSEVTAEEIKELVKSRLSQRKELRGGVVFLKEFPRTSTGKIARQKLQKIVLNSVRE